MVVEFSDNFQRANSTSIDSDNGWRTLLLGSGGASEVGITNTAAVTRGLPAAAYQQTTVPLTKDQWIRAVVGSSIESESGVDPYVVIGTMAQRGTNDYGFGVRLAYGASGTRTLDFIEGSGTGAESFSSIGATATVTLDSVSSTDLGVPQLLYFAVTRVRGGLRLRAAVNNEDLDEPDIDHIIPKDLPIGVGTSPSDYGDWYFGFGTAAQAGQILCYQFDAFDQLEALDREQGIAIPNQLTRSELRTRVLQRLSGGGASNTNLDATYVNEEINSAVAEVWHKGVDIWTFAEPQITTSIGYDDNGLWEAPYYMENVLDIWNTDRKGPSTWHEWGRTEDDRPVIKFRRDIEPSGFNAIVHYRARLQRMDADADPCMIPRAYADVVELAVLRNLSRDDSVSNRFQIYETRFRDRIMDMKRMENHKRQQRKRVFKALTPRRSFPGQLTPYRTTGV